MKDFLRTSDLARAVGLSVQAIRNYEACEFIPAAKRGPQGYRLYEERHLRALHVAQSLIVGFGWQNALYIMSNIHQRNRASAFARIDACHAEIHQSRHETEEMLMLLRITSTAILTVHPSGEQKRQKPPLRISEAAQKVGARVSAVRFWEECGLLQPERDQISKYRLYNAEHIRQLQIIVLLRKTGYNFEAIRPILQKLAEGTPEMALAVAERRLKELTEKSRRCMEATAALWTYIEEYKQQEE